ncbi:septin-1-like [Clupea harengus]|uniref:Septin-7 n=1 Tax=Clupea harengus TaxID=7950 RepID=A0A8M1KBC8_CLUHA|nr:septin-1-like [Clupea harengus]XP_042560285.1 septin-1-like [Clupea harengus]
MSTTNTRGKIDSCTQTDELDLQDCEYCLNTEDDDDCESEASSLREPEYAVSYMDLEAATLESDIRQSARPRSPWGVHDPYVSMEELGKSFVGFASLPHQIHRKNVKKGFDFTLMVVGESGLGKSTLINSLFLTGLYSDRILPNTSEMMKRTVGITRKTVDIEEKGVRLKLTIVDTPGFGDALDCTDSYYPIVDYLHQQMEHYHMDEMGMHRTQIKDSRVHCCLYFISPYGHGLKPLDVAFMKELQAKVNIVPVIGKADCLTKAELLRKKERIRKEIEFHKIKIFQFSDCDSDDDIEWTRQDYEMKNSIPFAVVGSNMQLRVDGRTVRVRAYPWGVVEVENPDHSDLVHLRTMLVRTHMQDLREKTHDNLYEQFRLSRMNMRSTSVVF